MTKKIVFLISILFGLQTGVTLAKNDSKYIKNVERIREFLKKEDKREKENRRSIALLVRRAFIVDFVVIQNSNAENNPQNNGRN